MPSRSYSLPSRDCPVKLTSHWNVKQICSRINGRPLVYYSYFSFVILMAGNQPFEIYSDGTTRFFHFEQLKEFQKYSKAVILNFSKACQEVDEKPFLLFVNPHQYLDRNPIFYDWLGNHSNAIMFINRGRVSLCSRFAIVSRGQEYFRELYFEN